MSAPNFTNLDLAWMEEQFKELRILCRDLHTSFDEDDPYECLTKCDGITAIASEVRKLVTRRAEQRMEVDERDETPGPDLSFASSFNGGRQ